MLHFPGLQELTIKDVLTLIVASTVMVVGIRNFLFSRRKDTTIQTYVFLNEWRSPDFYQLTRFIRGDFASTLTKSKAALGFRGLSEEEAAKLRRVTHFLDYAGRAMQTGVINKRILLTTIGEPVLILWQILGPLIIRERELMADELSNLGRPKKAYRQRWQGGFEHMAEEARRFRQPRAIRDKRYMGQLRPLGED